MDLDKLKKAAKEKGALALKKLIRATEPEEEDDINQEEAPENIADVEQPENETAESSDNTVSGETQRFDLNDILSRLKSEPGDQTYSEPEETEADAAAEEEIEESVSVEQTPEKEVSDITEIIAAAVNDIRAEIDKELGSTRELINERLNALDEQTKRLNDIYGRLGTLNSIVDKNAGESTKSAININGKLNAHDARLTEISNSLGSVSKLNDSIFDLKNSQMNTKNSLSELESSYTKLKRKMTAGVTIMSILCAIVVILEVMNLLS